MPLPKYDYNQINQLEIEVGEGSIDYQQGSQNSINQESSTRTSQETENNTIEIIIRDAEGNEKTIILSY